MKLHYKFAFILIVVSASAFGQILVGPVAGGNYSFTSFADKDLKKNYKVGGVFGYHAGAQLSFMVRKRFFLHTALVYSVKGRQLDTDSEASFKYSARYSFIELPMSYAVDFKARLGQSKEFKYFFGLGPNISYWLGGKGELMNNDLEENNIYKIDYRIAFRSNDDGQKPDELLVKQPNRFQFGLNFVTGVVLEPAPRQRIILTMRYELGHTYLAKSNGTFVNTYFEDPLKSTNQGFRLSIAYLYDLKTSDRLKGKSTVDPKHPK